jgi:hypothetical protein
MRLFCCIVCIVYCNFDMFAQISFFDKKGVCEIFFIKNANNYIYTNSIFVEYDSRKQYRFLDKNILKESIFLREIYAEFLGDTTSFFLKSIFLQYENCTQEPKSLRFTLSVLEDKGYARDIMGGNQIYLVGDTLKIIFPMSGTFLYLKDEAFQEGLGYLHNVSCELYKWDTPEGVSLVCESTDTAIFSVPKNYQKTNANQKFSILACDF